MHRSLYRQQATNSLDGRQGFGLLPNRDREAKRLVDESGALKGTQAPPVTNSPTGGVLSVHIAFAAIPARYVVAGAESTGAGTASVRAVAEDGAESVPRFPRRRQGCRTGPRLIRALRRASASRRIAARHTLEANELPAARLAHKVRVHGGSPALGSTLCGDLGADVAARRRR